MWHALPIYVEMMEICTVSDTEINTNGYASLAVCCLIGIPIIFSVSSCCTIPFFAFNSFLILEAFWV